MRSAFIHGRAGVRTISTVQRVTARRLARQVVRALVQRAATDQRTRDTILAALLAEGVALIPSATSER